MRRTLSEGDLAPNFDLASTEDVVLMLRDEVPRRAAVLYFFGDPTAEATRRDLMALSRRQESLNRSFTNILAISPRGVDELKAVQSDLKLGYPLLYDDRGLASGYGVEPASEERPQAPALFLVNRQQKILWAANPVESVESSLEELARLTRALPKSTENYPRRATNFLVDWWVHRKRSRA